MTNTDEFRFETERLRCGPWVHEAAAVGIELDQAVAEMLTPSTTRQLPDGWQGEYTLERARSWIAERQADSTVLLATERATGQPVGLVILGEVPQDYGVDLRIGYLIHESHQGQGIGSEVLAGLADHARRHPRITTLTGGVAPTNDASQRLLERAGFSPIDNPDGDELLYRLNVASDWDAAATGWDEDPFVRAYSVAAFASLQEILAESPLSLDGAEVLDFGCGTGLLAEQLLAAGASVYAVDSSPAMLDVLRAKTGPDGSGSLTVSGNLPRSGPAFDLVVASSVCGFLDDYPATVAELVSLLRPGGLFIQWDWERTPGDDHGLSRDEVNQALRGAGLTDIVVRVGFEIEVDGAPMAPLVGHGRRLS